MVIGSLGMLMVCGGALALGAIAVVVVMVLRERS